MLTCIGLCSSYVMRRGIRATSVESNGSAEMCSTIDGVETRKTLKTMAGMASPIKTKIYRCSRSKYLIGDITKDDERFAAFPITSEFIKTCLSTFLIFCSDYYTQKLLQRMWKNELRLGGERKCRIRKDCEEVNLLCMKRG